MFPQAMRALIDLLAPALCPGCDAELPAAQTTFCEVCAPLLEICPFGPAAYEYGGPMAEAITSFKYDGRTDFAAPLGSLLSKVAVRHLGQVDVVAPVPLHSSRRRARGYNQADLLARPVAKALGVPIESRLLRRKRPTPSQVGLASEVRALNVVGAFELRKPNLRFKRVLVIDDVMTTGATLQSCADVLYEGGATEVRQLALASSLLQ